MSSNGETVRDEHMLEGTGVAISIFVVLKLQHTCISTSIVLKLQVAQVPCFVCVIVAKVPEAAAGEGPEGHDRGQAKIFEQSLQDAR